ncbi:MAG: polysaccharide deacetylase family protein, partial [Geminicoccaceae bacterium]
THWGVDDWPPYVHSLELDYVMQVMSPTRAMEGFREEFEAAYEAGGLWIGVWHPFVSGRLARWRQVEELIEDMTSRGDVWLAPLEDIARHVLACGYQPRVDRLPYYDEPVMPIKR